MVALGIVLMVLGVIGFVLSSFAITDFDWPVPFVVLGISASAAAIVGGFVMLPVGPTVPCQSAPGDQIQWRVYQSGKSPRYYVYLAAPGEKQTFCRVDDKALSNMGLGYTTTRSYAGVQEVQP